ncbi:alpha/beta fold hydrolase [Pontibacillus yanchengensis]|uniref:Alpha/beta fold hydrolase n=2 Tax=Pontibacillus yanchengensis TaxID=462910 RepID=A0ACC7VEE2_9BACI|nr:alpha/beta hydrolase [Pontibacillus yanchengensis]MYL31999.1 alpha/beta fold hydrolase [Pontibacillus yanchengensis]MYL52576.1 alpha/beta fold hydrolase [Pontibacillus yanchengensis]
MIEKPVQFYSEGLLLQGSLYFPDFYQEGDKLPAIIPNSGYQGVNEFYPRMFAQSLTDKGYICLGFDYRGFADSEGDPARVLLEEQVQDIHNAITFLQLQEEVDHERIGLIGWGMGGSNVIRVTETNNNVSAVATLNGFYHGERWLKTVHSYEDWMKVLETVEQDRIRRVVEGESKEEEPFLHYPLDPATRDYVEKELADRKGFGGKTRIQFTESLLELDADRAAQNLEDIPLFVGHGVENILHPYEEAIALYEQAAEPKQFYRIEGKHNDFMYSKNSEYIALMDELETFFNEALA